MRATHFLYACFGIPIVFVILLISRSTTVAITELPVMKQQTFDVITEDHKDVVYLETKMVAMSFTEITNMSLDIMKPVDEVINKMTADLATIGFIDIGDSIDRL